MVAGLIADLATREGKLLNVVEAFHRLQISHIDAALCKDSGLGFPQDVIGMLRVLLRSLVLVISESDRTDVQQIAEPSQIEAAIDERLEIAVQLEQRRLAELEESTASIDWVGDALDETTIH